jgi:glutamate mutase epsilon subunit
VKPYLASLNRGAYMESRKHDPKTANIEFSEECEEWDHGNAEEEVQDVQISKQTLEFKQQQKIFMCKQCENDKIEEAKKQIYSLYEEKIK